MFKLLKIKKANTYTQLKSIAKEIPIYSQRMLELMEDDFIGPEYKWCEIIGLHSPNLFGIKKGTRFFTIEQMKAAAELHNTTMDYITGVTDVKEKPETKLSGLQMIEEGLRILKAEKRKMKLKAKTKKS